MQQIVLEDGAADDTQQQVIFNRWYQLHVTELKQR